MHSRYIVKALIVFLCVFPASALGQTATGGVFGTVTDPSGAVVSGAVVTIRSANTGYTQSSTTSSSGTYVFPSLEPGPYVISYQAGAFRSEEVKVQVPVGRAINGDHRMQLGTAQTTVEVEDSAAMVDTVQPVVEDVLTTEDIKSLP
jgi:hypothetical protein